MTINTVSDLEIPEKGFIDQYDFYMRRRPSVTLAVERKVVDPLLIRNTEQDRAETQVIAGKTRAQSNPEKFTTKERLTGLDLLRRIDEDDDLIHEEYTYNEPPALDHAINMDALTYGITGTGDQDYGMKSRLFTGYTYTIGEYDIMNEEVRNKAYESGTMTDEDGEHSQGLFSQVRVQPGNSFMHFLTIEAGTPAMLAYVLHNVLNTHGYGARETRSGKTVENHIRAVILSDHPALLSVGEFIDQFDPDPESEDIGRHLGNYLRANERADWEIYGDGVVRDTDPFPDWFKQLKAIAGRNRADSTEILAESLAEETSAAKENIPEA
ncbi:type I-D CRISPR-associated protein Cas7/Csc2 [Salinarchaeum sp. IM2453]|uniref:type I-D CRISPR-associated protein Cas7/Csc2 n=1 Tax=Salinarchaeum sp. IM2453 TaxID=2862870 RepID=UPI001C83BDE0|nr:type I-D CRISPR-associated protein Cas7/Csc2 [Salinarchaeum sp. IM2453]QZA89523.1 type I-D CRISPR-associated protein Cas7/Csc2 [Salinarchaeum sp. IM2453]